MTGAAVGESEAGSYRDAYFVNRDGLKIHYRDYPGDSSKPPLLCLPGLTRNMRDFIEFAELHSPRFRVILVEFRGRAGSDYDPVPARYNPMTYAGDVVELLQHLEVPGAIFVGTSLGGLVTMVVAATAPQLIVAAILNDIGPDVDPAGIGRILTYVGRDPRFKDWDEAASTISGNYGSAFDRYTHDDWVKMAKRNCREENGEIRFDYDMAIAEPFKNAGATPQPDLWPLFTALAAKPLLVVRGEKSDLLTAETAARMQSAAPQMRLAVVAGVGHAPELNEPEAVAAIDELLGTLG
ncbi:alpha/beta hydrolase [Sphingomonas limnosediminicola]|jgi:pimeloyl-ACP methyl ester carboxylesterase|uniref:Alpha/beta hydrolase n=1 Tax=Sphingomonas limnosediminicola TaxID=940133 RepID=A0ABP7LSC0_9SPHN